MAPGKSVMHNCEAEGLSSSIDSDTRLHIFPRDMWKEPLIRLIRLHFHFASGNRDPSVAQIKRITHSSRLKYDITKLSSCTAPSTTSPL